MKHFRYMQLLMSAFPGYFIFMYISFQISFNNISWKCIAKSITWLQHLQGGVTKWGEGTRGSFNPFPKKDHCSDIEKKYQTAFLNNRFTHGLLEITSSNALTVYWKWYHQTLWQQQALKHYLNPCWFKLYDSCTYIEGKEAWSKFWIPSLSPHPTPTPKSCHMLLSRILSL